MTDNVKIIPRPNNDIRNDMLELESRMNKLPGVLHGDCFPLKHSFTDGMYVREITMPKGAYVISKIHKKCHPYFILKGDVSVLTETGIERLIAPYSGITQPGTKRLLYCHEETVWTTVHATHETDLKIIEDQVIAKDFDEIKQTELKHFIDMIELPKGEQK